MRITHISDTHNKHNHLTNDLPGGDILIHSGDFTSIGRESEVRNFINWLKLRTNYTHKIFIAGNHDITFQSEKLFRLKSEWFDRKVYSDEGALGRPEWLEEILKNELDDSIIYLENSSVEIDGIKIWGSPYSPTFGRDWAFNVNRGHDAAELWSQIPTDTDVLITHTPIYGYCDRTYNTNENVGCADLYHKVHEVKPHLHFSGHIHEAHGWGTIPYRDEWGDTYTFNGSSCSLEYFYQNKPITLDYNFETRELNFI